jgi:hypothetical protein
MQPHPQPLSVSLGRNVLGYVSESQAELGEGSKTKTRWATMPGIHMYSLARVYSMPVSNGFFPTTKQIDLRYERCSLLFALMAILLLHSEQESE